jgi:hypothetical protein
MNAPLIMLQMTMAELRLLHVAVSASRIAAARKGEDGAALDALGVKLAGLRLDLLPAVEDSRSKVIVETVLKPMLRPKGRCRTPDGASE